jgi:uncharacterized membrane protein YbhN (UPF0104 family)
MSHRGRRLGIAIVKTLIGLAVVVAVGRHVEKIWSKLPPESRLIHVDPSWVAVSAALYFAGLLVLAFFFDRVLVAGNVHVGFWPVGRSYVISHLGKYVPGKALVVVMRVGMLSRSGARASTVTFASFYETLVMMATGGILAAALFATDRTYWPTAALALAVGGGFLALVSPPVFPRVSRLALLPFSKIDPGAIPEVSFGLLGRGLGACGVGWVLWGLSQVALVLSLDGGTLPLERWPVVISGVAFATIAGFVVALLPGGLGVREGVLMAALTPAVGETTAIVAALGLRLVWISVELVAAGLFSLIPPQVPERSAVP